ncbi:putative flavin monooxygenase, FAD/NAD(P)-binding domain-containing protein [Rosa chinensis]|uniref:Flavin-containing monooxygenase n=1 Tax=Rosa chinensis TaxID=74649 RepID=A0A2P6P884_ROSCH|nr:putative flavin monooxygenase, FAD/NAD(P)-binding domain-containing protein [Rosa chinensis]
MADGPSAHSATNTMHPLYRHVAVIGAGASGLVAARALRHEDHSVVVFERGDQMGATWVYTTEVESDPIGLHPNRTIVHSSMYQSLRTNPPREIMGFRDYPSAAKEQDEERDPRRFPGHREVLKYLNDFAGEFKICEMVRFNLRLRWCSWVWWRVASGEIKSVHEDGSAVFTDGSIVCFPSFELQSKWIAGVLSNQIALPSKVEMMEDVKAFYSSLEASGKPKRHIHDIFDYRASSALSPINIMMNMLIGLQHNVGV